MRKGRILFYFLLLFIFTGFLTIYLYLNSYKTKRSGKVQMQGLNSEVSVYYDTFGIPHIEAKNEEDAFYALGYAHAQDRLFQMEVLRRLAKGELSSILGKKLLKIDTFFRTLSIKEIAKKVVARMDLEKPQFKGLQNYIKGINRYMKKNDAIEYKILGIPKKPFTLEDTIAISGYMALSFSQAFKIDPVVHHIKNTLGKEYYQDFMTGLSHDPKAAYQNKIASKTLPQELFRNKLTNDILDPLNNMLPGVPVFIGSNAWVVSGALTKSGFPILANDPHIGFAAPSVWYEAHIKTPKFEIYGHYIAGIPIAPIGHTPSKAWGMTMLQNDDILFYKEKLNPDNKNEVYHKGGFVPLKYRKEKIEVKGEKPVILTIAETPRGPVINHMVDSYKDVKEPISMWWAFSNPKNDLISAFYGLAHTDNFKEIPKFLDKVYAPGLNLLYADKEKNIAWWPLAKIPRFQKDFPSKELLDPANPSHEIKDFLSFHEKPHSVNPPENFIVSANSDPKHIVETKNNIPGYYCNKQRFLRVKELLSAPNKKWDLESMKEIHLDDRDNIRKNFSKKIHEALSHVKIKENLKDLSKKSEQILLNWSGTHSAKKVGPTLYYTFLSQLVSHFFEEKFSHEMFKNFLMTHHVYNFLENIIKKEHSVWWHENKEKQTQETVIASLWEKTLESLTKFIGPDPQNWHWEKAHIMEHIHVIGRKKPFNHIFNVGPKGLSGGYEVVNNQRFILTKKLPFHIRSGPSTRRLIDLKDTKISFGINPTGQSGYFFDKHYKDQFELYTQGKYREQIMDMAFIKKTISEKLTLF